MDPAGFFRRWLASSVLLIVAWTAALAACGGAAAPAQPSLTVDPTAGGAGTVVTVTGEGFPAGAAINIRLGPPDVGASPEAYGMAVATEEGAFVASFVVPETWPDGRPIVEEALLIIALIPDGSVKATAPFEYRPAHSPAPQLALDPPNGEPGQRLAVIGAHFRPGTAIVVRLAPPSDAAGEKKLALVVADEHGSFRTAVGIPLVWPRTGALVREQTLMIEVIRAVDEQLLAQAAFLNVHGEQPPE